MSPAVFVAWCVFLVFNHIRKELNISYGIDEDNVSEFLRIPVKGVCSIKTTVLLQDVAVYPAVHPSEGTFFELIKKEDTNVYRL